MMQSNIMNASELNDASGQIIYYLENWKMGKQALVHFNAFYCIFAFVCSFVHSLKIHVRIVQRFYIF